jgi:hypothetical protein
MCILVVNQQSGKTFAQSQTSTTPSEVPTVSFCKVIHNPELYDGKVVRIQAIWFQNFEWSWLYAYGLDTCDSRKNFIRPFLDCAGDACKEMQGILNKNLKGDPFDGMHVGLVLVGRFHYRREPLMNGEGQNGAWYFKLGVTSIEEVKKIPEESGGKPKS